jgi:hypothetical protein
MFFANISCICSFFLFFLITLHYICSCCENMNV